MRSLNSLVGASLVIAVTLAGCTEGDDTAQRGTYAWCETDYPPASNFGPYAAVSFPDPLIGTIVGGIHRTTNGGVTWTTQEPLIDGRTYNDVMFTDADTGTIVGPAGTIRRTIDGGETWVTQDSDTEATLYGVSFADASHGMAVGSTGTIVRTGDGGDTWDSPASITNAELRGVWMIDANTATTVGTNGTILRTTDGGETWDSQESGTDAQLNAVSFASGSTGVVVSATGAVLRTTDGGATWTQSHDFSPFALNDVWFATENVGTIVGASGTILRTTDAGATWISEMHDAAYWHWDSSLPDAIRVEKNFTGVSMADAENGVAVGDYYAVARRMTVSDEQGVCDPWCAKLEECAPESIDGCNIDCLCNLRYHANISEECEETLLESYGCFSALTCEEFEAWWEDPDNHQCTAVEMRIEVVCDTSGLEAG